jgi:serine/threonine protein kinase
MSSGGWAQDLTFNGTDVPLSSFGLLLLEASANVILPDNGNAWRKLRANDFSDINVDISPPLFHLIRSLSQSTPTQRITIDDTLKHPVLSCLAQRSMGSNSSLRGAVVEEDEGFLDDLLSEAAEARHPSSMDI